jgi:hypothetical protein
MNRYLVSLLMMFLWVGTSSDSLAQAVSEETVETAIAEVDNNESAIDPAHVEAIKLLMSPWVFTDKFDLH